MRIGRAQGQDLAAQTRGQPAGDQRGDQEHAHRHHALARADLQGETRLDEEEVVGDKTQQCGNHRSGHARARSHQHHCDDEHHRQVIDIGPALQQPRHPHRTSGRDRSERHVVALQPLARVAPALARTCARIGGADDHQFVMRATLQQLLGQRAVEHARQRALAGAPQHQGGDAVLRGEIQQGIGHIGAMQQRGVATEAMGERECAIDFQLPGCIGHGAGLHGDHRPRCIAPLRQTPRHAHQIIRAAAAIDGHHHAASQRGGARQAARGLGIAQIAVDAVGSGLHRQLAQGGEVGRREKRLQCLRGLLGQIHLALLQALDQFAWRQVHQHDVAQAVEHGIGHGLGHAHAGDAQHDVVEAFQVLDVDRGVDVDPGIEQLHDVLPAPLMAAAGHVAVRQLVDQGQPRLACQQCIQVEFFQHAALVTHAGARQQRQAFQQRRGFAAPVRFHHAGHHIHALAQALARPRQHGVGLADPGRGAQEHRQPTTVFAL